MQKHVQATGLNISALASMSTPFCSLQSSQALVSAKTWRLPGSKRQGRKGCNSCTDNVLPTGTDIEQTIKNFRIGSCNLRRKRKGVDGQEGGIAATTPQQTSPSPEQHRLKHLAGPSVIKEPYSADTKVRQRKPKGRLNTTDTS